MMFCFDMKVLTEGCSLTRCAGCVVLITIRKYVGQPYSRIPYSVLHTDCPSSTEYGVSSAEEETPEQLEARLHLMSGRIRDHPVTVALFPGKRTRGGSPPATPVVND